MCDGNSADVQMDDFWRSLQPGDLVRIIHVPREFASAPDTYLLHDETRELYEHLVAESAILRITEIDDWGVPWIDYTWIRSGVEEFHSLGLNHDGLASAS